jgi:hypothetical protein
LQLLDRSPTAFPHRNTLAVELLSPPFLLAVGTPSPANPSLARALLQNQGEPLMLLNLLALAAGDPLRQNAAAFSLSSVKSG